LTHDIEITVDQVSSIFRLTQGDITQQTTDAIVNAANSQLILGARVAGAIRKNGGLTIQQECNAIIKLNGVIPVGSTAITHAGDLMSKYVIHAIGPIWSDYSESKSIALLKDSVDNSLNYLNKREYKINSITFPAISTGIFGFPKKLAASTIISTIFQFLSKSAYQTQKTVQICLFSEEDFQIFESAAKNQF
jgi:O-acetyl-ADP-ribose deacetylase